MAWLYPPLAGLIFGDFHENSFAPAAVAWMLYAFDAGLMPWTIVFALRRSRLRKIRRFFSPSAGRSARAHFRGTARGRVAAAVAAISLASARSHSLQSFNRTPPRIACRSGSRSASTRGVRADARAILPGSGARLGFLLLIFAPLLFLPLRTRVFWLAVAPLAEVLLSRMPTTFTLGTHYAGAWIGYVLAAFAFGCGRLEPRRIRSRRRRCVALCLIEFVVADPLHPGMNLRAVESRDAALDQFLTTLPS